LKGRFLNTLETYKTDNSAVVAVATLFAEIGRRAEVYVRLFVNNMIYEKLLSGKLVLWYALFMLFVPGIRRKRIQISVRISQCVSSKTSSGEIQDAMLSPKCGPTGKHLPRHLEGNE